jgi:hypothetical protein
VKPINADPGGEADSVVGEEQILVERNRWNAVEVEPGDTPQRRILSRARKTRQFRMKTRGSGRGRTNIGDGEVQKRKKSSRERERENSSPKFWLCIPY